MLKIKNNVDLKELEKYGFKPVNYINQRTHQFVTTMADKEINNLIIGEDRVLHYNQMSVHNELPDVIYDLIKDGLVENMQKEDK